MKKEKNCNVFFVLFMTFVLMFVGETLFGIIFGFALGLSGVDLESINSIILNYAPFIGIPIVIFLYTYFARKDIYSCYFKGLKGNTIKMLLLGLLVGFASNVVCILPALLNGDVTLKLSSVNWALFALSFILVFIQSSAEELLTRGYMFLSIRKRYGFYLAFILSSVFFAALHLFNPGITVLAIVNLVVIGAFYALIVHYFDSLWFVMAAHAGWNFTQNFILGLPNSGLPAENSLLMIGKSNNGVLYDNVFGIEGTIITLIVNLLMIAFIIYYKNKQNNTKTKKA